VDDFSGEAVGLVSFFRIADGFGVGAHVGEGDFLVAEEVEGDFGVVPGLVAGAPVFADEVVLGELVAEVIFDTPAAAEEIAPEDPLAGLVNGGAFVVFGHSGVVGVGWHAVLGVAGFVEGDCPGVAGFEGGAVPFDGLPVDVFWFSRIQLRRVEEPRPYLPGRGTRSRV
jgi:hypothetical protein